MRWVEAAQTKSGMEENRTNAENGRLRKWRKPPLRTHNLKVIGSNPIPATKVDAENPAISIDRWVFGFMVKRDHNKINDLVS
jgi:hypothetical protein